MRFKLIHKLLVINVGIILALTASSVMFSRSVSTGMFSNALNGIDQDVMRKLVDTLGEHYKEHGSWDRFINDHTAWADRVNQTFFPVFFSLIEDSGNNPMNSFPGLAQTEEGFMPSNVESWNVPFGTFLQRCALLDEKQSVLIKPEFLTQEVSKKAIRVEGEVVGWIQVGKINVDILPLAQYFFEQQMKIIYWSTIIGGLVAAALSILFSRILTAPIKKLTVGAKAIAERKFDTKINVASNDEFQDLAESFNSLSQELASYALRQRQWLSNISHDLKAPLTVLVGEIYAICDNLSSCDEKTINLLQDEVNHVKRLADDLFEMSKGEELGFQYQFSKIDLSQVIHRQIQHYETRFKENHLDVTEHQPPHSTFVLGDENRLAQVFGNLLENCIRYVNSPGKVNVNVTQGDNAITVELEDSGPGVSTTELDKLFDRFYSQHESDFKKARGTGLGLAICQEIIHGHQGSIVASKGTNGGLLITIILPNFE